MKNPHPSTAGSFPEMSKSRARYSLRFLVPGIIYAVNNNLYMYALTMIAPPIWVILVSMRTVITTLSYKVRVTQMCAYFWRRNFIFEATLKHLSLTKEIQYGPFKK